MKPSTALQKFTKNTLYEEIDFNKKAEIFQSIMMESVDKVCLSVNACVREDN